MEVTLSQILDLGLSFDFMLKHGKIWLIFRNILSIFDKMKTETYIKNLRHGSLDIDVVYMYV